MLSSVPLVPQTNPETVSRRESILSWYSFRLLPLLMCDVYSTALNLSYKRSQPDNIYKKSVSEKSLKLKTSEKLEQLRNVVVFDAIERIKDPDLNMSD